MQGLVAVQAVLCDEGPGGRLWGAGGVAQSPGKRKRTRKRWCLQDLAQAPLQHEVSCIHVLPFPQGDFSGINLYQLLLIIIILLLSGCCG